jgi:cell pole-organizing protein PopZ
MSGSNNEISNSGGPVSSAEPSMEEILASIRRILKDDQPAQAGEAEPEEDIFVLDSSMVVKPGTNKPGLGAPPPFQFEPSPAPGPSPAYLEPEPIRRETGIDPEAAAPGFHDEPLTQPHLASATNVELPSDDENEIAGSYAYQPEPAPAHSAKEEQDMSENSQENVHSPDGLVSEAATNAAAGSIGALIRSISSDRQVAVGRPGLTLEDLVREELRPLLKSWLDSNLPALVERIVRAEIQRVIERSTI